MFPAPGQPLSSLGERKQVVIDGERFTLLPGIDYVIRVIETIKPVRIVSAHGKSPRVTKHLTDAVSDGIINMTADEIKSWDGTTAIKGVNFTGIYVDPRYQPSDACRDRKNPINVEACKFDPALDPAFPLISDPANAKKRFDSALTPLGRKDDALARAAAQKVFSLDKMLVRGTIWIRA
jgi:hypothetical protein